MARVHYAWVVAGVAFATLVAAAAVRAAPGVLMVPLHDELGWPIVTMSAAVGVGLVLYGLTAPFAAALMERFGLPCCVTGRPISGWRRTGVMVWSHHPRRPGGMSPVLRSTRCVRLHGPKPSGRWPAHLRSVARRRTG